MEARGKLEVNRLNARVRWQLGVMRAKIVI